MEHDDDLHDDRHHDDAGAAAASGGFLTGLLLGALLGAGAALLFAPQRGVRTRRQIGRRVKEVRDRARQAIEARREGRARARVAPPDAV